MSSRSARLPVRGAKRNTEKPASRLSPRLAALARETLLLVLSALAVYLLLCLASYTPQDPGWSHSGSPDHIANLGGRVGAWIADILLHGFGYVAYLFPVLIALSALRIYRQRLLEGVSLYQQMRTGAGFVVSVLSACGLERLHLGGLSDSQSFIAGGVIGDLVAGALTENFGIAGATMFLLVLFAAGVSWFTEVPSFAVIDTIGRLACGAWDRFRSMIPVLTEKWAKRAATPVEPASAAARTKGPAAAIRAEISRRKPPRIEPQVDKPAAPPQVVARRPAAPRITKTQESGEIPPLSLLDEPDGTQVTCSHEALESMSRLIEKKLMDFNVAVQVRVAHPGPVITRFEIEPAPGIKASQITGLSRDLARALGVFSVRVVENIPGKTVIGLEVPNEQRETVRLVEGLASREYQEATSPLTLVLGKDIGGLPVLSDLGRMPHVLIAGTTGSGKSVCINALILSILYKATARDVRLIMIDPKMLELSVYDGIAHLLTPVVTDMKEATNALRWCIGEMDRRFHLMAALGVRNIAGYNRKVQAAIDAGKPIVDPLVTDPEVEAMPLDTIPYVVVIIDELADLLMVVGKKAEELITRIAQRARAAGIHLVLATQRPSVDVITGLIKANVPTRIAFQVSSRADSRTVLDQMGAEQLLGHGDMLFLPPGTGAPVRVHGSFVSDQEVHQVVAALKGRGTPDYNPDVTAGDLHAGDPIFGGADAAGGGGEEDALYDQALQFVTETRRASISAVQRHLRVGYNRAARMIEAMEQAGVVGRLETNGRRDVLAPPPPDV